MQAAQTQRSTWKVKLTNWFNSSFFKRQKWQKQRENQWRQKLRKHRRWHGNRKARVHCNVIFILLILFFRYFSNCRQISHLSIKPQRLNWKHLPLQHFLQKRDTGAAAPEKLETLHCCQQPLIVLLVPHQGQNMPSPLFNDATWPLVGVRAAFCGCSQQYLPRTWDHSNPGVPNTVCRPDQAH